MIEIIQFVFFILNGLLGFLGFCLIVNAIASWLVHFGVINAHNQMVYGLLRALEVITEPILAPIRRILPYMGGLDISPVLAILVLNGIQAILLPAAEMGMIRILTGSF